MRDTILILIHVTNNYTYRLEPTLDIIVLAPGGKYKYRRWQDGFQLTKCSSVVSTLYTGLFP